MLKKNSFNITVVSALLVIIVILGILATKVVFAKEEKNVTMLLWRWKDKSEQGFQDVLNSSNYKINWVEYNAEQNEDKLIEIIKGLDLTQIDLIYTFGTTVTKTTREYVKNVPIVSNIVSAPVASGIITSWEHSGNNITCVSNKVPTEVQIKTLKRIMNFKRLGVIHNPAETNSRIWIDEGKKLEKKYDFTLVVIEFTNKKDINNLVRTLEEEKVDAVWLPPVSAIKANQDILIKAINDRKLPSLSPMIGLATMKKESVLLGLGPSYYKLGELAAQKAIKIFEGIKPTDIPSETLEEFDLIINLKTAKIIGLAIPNDILEIASEIVK